MTTRVLLPSLLLVFGAWVQPSQAAMTPKQQETVRAEVSRAVKSFIAACEQVDVARALAFEADVPEFLYADADGSMYEYPGFRELVTRSFAASSSQKVITRREKILVLAPDLVLYAWNGALEMTPKGGTTVHVEPYSLTLLMRKVAGAWRITYQHESGQVPPGGSPAPTAPKE